MPTVVPRLLLPLAAVLLAALLLQTAVLAEGELARSAEARFFDAHNEFRADPEAAGFEEPAQDALRWAPDLAEVARDWSVELIDPQVLQHNPDYTSQTCCWRLIGENVGVASGVDVTDQAAVEGAVDRLMTAFLNSDGHRANTAQGRFTQIGIGVALDDDHDRLWVTMVFREPTSDAPADKEHPFDADADTGAKDEDEKAPGDGSTEDEKALADTPAWQCDTTPQPLSGDFNGNGTAGIGWYCDGDVLLQVKPGDYTQFRFGRAGDVALVSDFNGDGKDTVGVSRGSRIFLTNQLAGGAAEISYRYGRDGDVTLVGDFDGNGKDTVTRVRDDRFFLRFTLAGGSADETRILAFR